MGNYRSWILTDSNAGVWQESFKLTAGDLGQRPKVPWTIQKTTLHGGLRAGVDLIEVDNGHLRFSVLPTRGMGIWRGDYNGLTLGWNSPVKGPVHPGFVHAQELGGLGWLQGFDEFIVRCGLQSNGPPGIDKATDARGQLLEMPLTLHGRIANIPASKVEVRVGLDDPAELCVLGIVDEAVLFGPGWRLITSISTRVGSNQFRIEDQITNMRGTEDEFQLLYHCNFGPPFLEDGAQLIAPSQVVAPRDAHAAESVEKYADYNKPMAGITEQVYWHKLAADAEGDSAVMLQNASATLATLLKFNLKTLPCFTQWKNTAAAGEGYVTGLEPATNFPNFKAFEREQGRVLKLAGGESYRTGLTLEVLDTEEAVSQAAAEISKLNSAAPQIHARPARGFSPQE